METRTIVYMCLFAALMAVGAYLFLPPAAAGGIPFTMQVIFLFLCGLLLRPVWALSSMALYVFIGLIGFPVFSQGGSGPAHILGPRGGFLAGFLPGVWIISMISSVGLKAGLIRILQMALDLAALIAGLLIIYVLGALWYWYKVMPGQDFSAVLDKVVLIFIPLDSLKIIIAVILAQVLRPVMGKTGLDENGRE